MATVRKFSEHMLKLARKQHSPKDFVPQFVNNHWRPPRISLRRQADLRKACLIQGLDPVKLGIPPKAEHKPLRTKPPKGTKYQRNYEERKAKVEKLMAEMPKKIEAWREEKRQEKLKAKSTMPF
jgi:hypothetical protein